MEPNGTAQYGAPEYPYAEAALGTDIPYRGAAIVTYNWTYSDPVPVNFTAVEIITFLPTLFHNYWIARRFINNGISNGQHLEILNFHREANHGVDKYAIANSYLDAMRGKHWRQLPSEEQKGLWSRKSQQTPDTWNRLDISMNGFQPDNSYGPMPPVIPVPIVSLLQGVKKIPKGPDAADLTRAIEFGVNNTMVDGNGNRSEYMFPDHLALILNTVGRTNVGVEHSDGSVAWRWEQRRRDRMNEEKKAVAQAEALAQAEVSAQAVQQFPMMLDAGGFSNDISIVNSINSPTTLTERFDLDNEELIQHAIDWDATKDLSLCSLANAYPPTTLLRECGKTISDDDRSQFAQAVRFAQQKDQIGIDWVVEDMEVIGDIIWSNQILGNVQRHSSAHREAE